MVDRAHARELLAKARDLIKRPMSLPRPVDYVVDTLELLVEAVDVLAGDEPAKRFAHGGASAPAPQNRDPLVLVTRARNRGYCGCTPGAAPHLIEWFVRWTVKGERRNQHICDAGLPGLCSTAIAQQQPPTDVPEVKSA